MSAEGFHISNPATNNRDLAIWYTRSDGQRKRLALLKPGDSYRCEKKSVSVEETQRPLRLVQTDEGFVPDRSSPKNKLKSVGV